METLKLTFVNIKTKSFKDITVESLYSDAYFENGCPNEDWLTYLAEKQIDLKGYYLYSMN
tara:strand:- start:1094 stop:1273 length:180 start_codon:yes stop_codon:yes gene_type:complete